MKLLTNRDVHNFLGRQFLSNSSIPTKADSIPAYRYQVVVCDSQLNSKRLPLQVEINFSKRKKKKHVEGKCLL